MKRLLVLLLVSITASLHAHPVAQGALELRVEDGTATASLRVSNEQVFVAESLGEGAGTAASFDDMLTRHGAYILRHFSVLADGATLPGTVGAVLPPEDRSEKGFTTYHLRYALPAQIPALIEVRQDLLTEILYAPGNPWEAPLAARVWQDGRILIDGALLTARQSLKVPLGSVPGTRLAWDFFRYGFAHIGAGLDHALFVAALVLALPGFWRVVALVTVFTLAHTITITLAVLGLVDVPAGVVEPLIAASIVAAAGLCVFRPGTLLLRARLGVAFGFGLFHGLGFAGGLVAAMQGFAPGALVSAIGGFSVGVELGHQVIVLPLLGIMSLLRRRMPASVPATIRGGGALIGAAGLWLLWNTLR